MTDLIRREDAINALNECNDIRGYAYRQMHDALTEIPSVKPKRGEWIVHKERTETNGKFIDFFPAEYECSNCGLREAHYFINSKPHNYCPNCGARMKGADDKTN